MTNCYDKLFDTLRYGPQPRAVLLKAVGVGFAARVSEWNKRFGYSMPIACKDGLYEMDRVASINVKRKAV
jgi:hypothetical protein